MPRPEAIKTEHSVEWHWEKFAEFCRFKAEVREPSPHLQMLGVLTEGLPYYEKAWFICLYANFYNIPSAMVMYKEWPFSRVCQQADWNELGKWLLINWEGLATRTERRAVRTVKNMFECLVSLAYWIQDKLPLYTGTTAEVQAKRHWPDLNAAYDAIWVEAENDLRFMGRYIIIRLLEAMHRFMDLEPHLYDIRSIGGWSPKLAIGLLYPEYLPLLLSPDTKENVHQVDLIAYHAIATFEADYSTPMSPYVFAAMLCEYRVAYEKRHQYPGWTIDQEPAYWLKIDGFWQEKRGYQWAKEIEEKFLAARLALFPVENLGEIQGWPSGTRVEPRSTLRDHGYNWSDKRYDYELMKFQNDFANPVRRQA